MVAFSPLEGNVSINAKVYHVSIVTQTQKNGPQIHSQCFHLHHHGPFIDTMLGHIYTERQHQRRVNVAMMLVILILLQTMETNGVT